MSDEQKKDIGTSSSRGEIIKLFYKELLGRQADDSGLKNYLDSDHPLEVIYLLLRGSSEAIEYRKKKEEERKQKELEMGKLPISLCMIVKDCADSVHIPINSAKSVVDEVVVLDTGSTDNTIEVCRDLGAYVYKCGFTDFGSMKTLVSHLAKQPWVLVLDSDESILKEDLVYLEDLIKDKSVDAYAFPRKRWLDLEMTIQMEPEVYPDWQLRMFRNNREIKYVRRVHENLEGYKNLKECPEGPHIQHFQDVFKKGKKLKERNDFYKALYAKDLSEGIEHAEPVIAEIDNVD